MNLSCRSLFGLVRISALLGLIVVGCDDSGPTDPIIDGIQLAKAPKDVEVTATDPDWAPQDTLLDVRVLGDNFDRGSVAEFQLGGVPAEKVKVKNTRFVSRTELVAEVEVQLDAPTELYDVEVTTSRGKKGIGTDLFRVYEKGTKPPTGEFVVTGFEVSEVPRSQAPDVCPDPANPCNKLTLTYDGRLDSLRFKVGREWEGLYFDPTLENGFRVVAAWLRFATGIIVPADPNIVEAYWQGQWRPSVNWECWDAANNCDPYGPVEYVIDRGPDQFVFSFSYWSGNTFRTGIRPRETVARATYRGSEPDQPAYVVIDDVELVPGKNKKSPAKLRFETQAFSHPSLHDGTTTLFAYTSVMVTKPDGQRSMVARTSVGTEHPTEPDIFKSGYEMTNLATGCYTIRIVGVVTTTGWDGHNSDRFAAWDSAVPVAIGVDYDGESIAVIPDGCSS
jgi:hypothetical protein